MLVTIGITPILGLLGLWMLILQRTYLAPPSPERKRMLGTRISWNTIPEVQHLQRAWPMSHLQWQNCMKMAVETDIWRKIGLPRLMRFYIGTDSA